LYLYVLRHGKAVEGYPDEIRELTDRGCADLNAVLVSCKEKVEPLEHILSSPLVRAQQTAKIAAEVFGYKGHIPENENITPWGSPQAFLDSLNETSSLLIASHQPYVSILIEYLTGRRIAMQTASLAAVKVDYPSEGGGELLWHREP